MLSDCVFSNVRSYIDLIFFKVGIFSKLFTSLGFFTTSTSFRLYLFVICGGLIYKDMFSGQIQEDGFVAGCMSLEEDMLESILDFQILPNYMKEKLHQNLPEVEYDNLHFVQLCQVNFKSLHV